MGLLDSEMHKTISCTFLRNYIEDQISKLTYFNYETTCNIIKMHYNHYRCDLYKTFVLFGNEGGPQICYCMQYRCAFGYKVHGI